MLLLSFVLLSSELEKFRNMLYASDGALLPTRTLLRGLLTFWG